jgi:hypothetical protein
MPCRDRIGGWPRNNLVLRERQERWPPCNWAVRRERRDPMFPVAAKFLGVPERCDGARSVTADSIAVPFSERRAGACSACYGRLTRA